MGFQCNLCGYQKADLQPQLIWREGSSCDHCHSTARFRAMGYLVTKAMFGKGVVLAGAPERKDIVGWGMSDSESYATYLRQVFSYTNTFYHQEPYLDITGPVKDELKNSLDFLVSSDVFEHVSPPVIRAFQNAYALLRPGGTFVFSMPYYDAVSEEHFPDLHEYELREENGQFVLNNLREDGGKSRYESLIFHGGPGTVLEMRKISKTEMIACLEKAGFVDIEFCHHVEEFGIFNHYPLPLTARKPSQSRW
jgi:SAM-dependent methyltransferase